MFLCLSAKLGNVYFSDTRKEFWKTLEFILEAVL